MRTARGEGRCEPVPTLFGERPLKRVRLLDDSCVEVCQNFVAH